MNHRREPDTQVRVETGEATIRIWDRRTGTTLSSLVAPEGPVRTLDWHPDGRRLVSVCGIASTRLRIWDTASGREIAGWLAGWEAEAAFSPDGGRLVWGHLPVRVTDLESGRVVVSSRDRTTGNGTWSPAGDRIASTSGGGVIKIWDAASGEDLYSIPGHMAVPWQLSWSPNAELLAMPYHDGTIRIWDTEAGRKIINPGTPGDTSHWTYVAFCPDGKRLLVGGPTESWRIYDVESGALLRSGKHALAFQRPDWSPDGKRFATSAMDYSHRGTPGWSVQICDARTGEVVLLPLQCEYEPGSLAWSPDGNILAVGLRGPGRVILFAASTGKQLAASDYLDGERVGLAWSPDGKRLAGAGGPELRFWDSAHHPWPLAATPPAGFRMDWSPDGKKLVTGRDDGTITIYDAASGTPLHVLRAHGYVQAVQWHPWMPRIASGGRDGMIRIWDSSTGQELCALQTHNSIVRDLDWSPDGWRLASTGGDGSVRIWDASPANQFFKRHGDLRARVWRLIGDSRGREHQAAMRPEFQEALDLLERLRALHPGDKELKWQTQWVEWFRATQLARTDQTAEAIAVFQQLTAEVPDLPDYHLALPGELFIVGKETQAIALLEKWVAEFPQRSEYHEELAFLYERRAIQLCKSGDLPGAVSILRRLAQEFPERPGHRSQVVRRLTAQLPSEQAIAVFRKLAHEFPDAPEYREEACVNLGIALSNQGKYAEAEAQCREALRMRPNYLEAHAKLGIALACQGKDAEAEAEYRQALDLRPGARAAFLNPSLALQRQRKFTAAARLFAKAEAAELKLAEDPSFGYRYNAACCAVLAGCGLGSDASKLDDAERAQLRRQALDWLRADLAAWGQLVEKTPDQARPLAQEKLRFWQQDADFNGVRGAALAKLPEAERQAWQQLWKDVVQMLKRVNR
jgi:WD40 repeat protein/tetratricopeptide (TPR) repeat protein